MRADVEKRMERILRQLGIGLKVELRPPSEGLPKAELKLEEGRIVIRAANEAEAWSSLIHEVVELRLRPILSLYREVVNALIGFVEAEAYRRKEQAIEQISRDLPKLIEEAKKPPRSDEES